jgi:hypothetical protein
MIGSHRRGEVTVEELGPSVVVAGRERPAPTSPRVKNRREPEEQTRAKSTLRLNRQTELQTETECYIYARIRGIAQIIDTVYFDDINVLCVEPVAGPRINKFEVITAVLEAMIVVIASADMKGVFASKVGLEPVIGNATATPIIFGVLFSLPTLGLLSMLLCAFLFWPGVLLGFRVLLVLT